MKALLRSCTLLTALALAACGPAEDGDDVLGEEPDGYESSVEGGNLWEAGDADEPPEPGKADAILATRAVPVTADDADTQVWKPTRNWTDKVNVNFDPYFKTTDNITWNEAFRRWVDKLEQTTAVAGWKTYKLKTPWGKTLPIAALECAEQAMFLRVTFAAWFKLPFFLEALDGRGNRMFAGHFGFRKLTGAYPNFPTFKTWYRDHGATAPATWPQDAKLRAKKLGGDDTQNMIVPGQTLTMGAYLDEIHLNKRVGHFTLLMLSWFGSVNLADPANTFHIKPASIRTGDVLLERWQRAGIGHTLNVKSVQQRPNNKLAVELASGSMPRRQSVWESSITSRRYFLNELMGGPGNNSEGIPYAKLGGGIRRWRTAIKYNGSWVNTVPGDSTTAWINSTNLTAIANRIQEFEDLLEVADPAVRRAELKTALATARQYQREHPASCSNREKREGLINDLAQLEDEDNYWSREESEQEYRSYDDYVFPMLKYERSKTCCWNTTTAKMGDIAIKANKAWDRASAQCRVPTPFTSENYAKFKTWAQQNGRAADWKDWTEDEPCPQRTVTADTISPDLVMEPYCEIKSYLPDAG